jgi:hypothetical protein
MGVRDSRDFDWLCGLRVISPRTLSGFRSEHKAALDDLFVHVLGMLSQGLITLERVTLDGTKIKANAGGNTLRRKEELEVHLELARDQVRILNAAGEEEEKDTTADRQAAARRQAVRQRASQLEAAVREVERLQEEKQHIARTLWDAPPAPTGRACDEKRRGRYVPSYNG